MSSICTLAPFDFVDLFLDLQALQIVKLGFMRLKLGMKSIFASFFLPLHLYKYPRGYLNILSPLPLNLHFRFSQKEPLDHPCRRSQDSCQCDQIQPRK